MTNLITDTELHGTWSFGGLATNRFFRAEIEDFTAALNAAVSDWLKPV